MRNLGLGFPKEPNGGEEQERERMEKVMKTGLESFYVASKPGRIRPGPLPFHSPSFDLDPDGSGSIQRSWSVSLIQIYQIHGLWAYYPWVEGFSNSLNFLTICTIILAV